MFTRIFTLLLLAPLACAMSPRPPATVSGPRAIESFDHGWRFLQSDVNGPEQPDFDDSSWRELNVPHDWSIEGPFDPKHPTRGQGGFLPSGVAWYRKAFVLPPSAAGRRVFIEFDGVMHNSDVWINGHHLGHRPYGYVSFRYDLTAHLRPGKEARNVVVVRADTSKQPASRWYSGAGIYRHVRLIITDPVHVEQWATFVSSGPVVTVLAHGQPGEQTRSEIQVQTSIRNSGDSAADVHVDVRLLDASGTLVGAAELGRRNVPPNTSAAFEETVTVRNPKLWDVDHPHLHRAEVSVRANGRLVDRDIVTFGIRDAQFDSQVGFRLNGRVLRLYGVCLHHDGGAFGAAVPLAVWEQRLRALRELGTNAIRTAHNPPDPGFLDLCDRLGFLVMDELFDCWTVAKNRYDYHLHFNDWARIDVRDTVRRDRNHPSVVLYSAGNEIHDTRKPELAKSILRGLVEEFHANDPTRPVTQALFRPNVSGDYRNGLADLLDVVGTNYRDDELVAAWKDKPTRKIVGTEQRHDRETWLVMRDNPMEAGQFLWTGHDYLGESRAWPTIGYGSGLYDRAGALRPLGRERQSWWTTEPMVAIARRIAPEEISQYDPGYEPTAAAAHRRQLTFSDWSPLNREPHEELVEVYSNCDTVELFLNGRSLGAQPINADASPRVWKVAFEAGTLRAVARNGGKDVAVDELKTAGPSRALRLRADREAVSSDWEDVVRVAVSVVDESGVPVPTATPRISFAVSGPGELVAVDNGDNASAELFRGTERSAYQGRCFAWVRATADRGTITLRATAAGLDAGEVKLRAR